MPKLLIPKPYKKVIDSSAVTQKGLIDVHKIDNKYLFEISDSILGSENDDHNPIF